MATDAPIAFFSYSREDSDFALKLAGDLKAAGAAVWIDQLDIEPGMRWDRAVEAALNNCPRMLVILSPASVNNDNVLDEVSFALSKQKRVIPVLYRECDIPFRLARLQRIDFSADYDQALKVLLNTLGVQPPPQPNAPAPSAPKKRRGDVSDENKPKGAAKQKRAQPAGQQTAEETRQAREIYQQIAETAQRDKAERERLAAELKGSVFQQTPEQLPTAERTGLGEEGTPASEPAPLQQPGTLKLVEQATGRSLLTLHGHLDVWGVAVSANGQLAVAASSDETLTVWDLELGRELRTLKGQLSAVRGVALSQDGRLAISASQDGTLKIWDVSSGREVRTIQAHSRYVNAVAINADGELAVSASDDRTVKVWDLTGGREPRVLEGHSGPVLGVGLSADGRLIISASEDKTLRVWESDSGREICKLVGHTGWVRGVAMSGNGQLAASASGDHTVRIWDLAAATELHSLKGHAAFVNGVAMSADGERVVSASRDKSLRVWEAGSGREVATFRGNAALRCCAISADGKTIVAGGDRDISYTRLE